ncbi:MAG: polysaccharide deacetylase family protein [Syntrophobacterales bacterium]
MGGRLGVKVDVDTLEGFRKGVPALLKALGERGIKASFYVSLGPDHSGRAILRLFRQRGFLEKMCRTRAPAIYGIKTMLYGILLPGPLIGAAAPEILSEIRATGHEVGLHGYDHVRWHDHLSIMGVEEVSREVSRAQAAFAEALGVQARAFAAPGWQCFADQTTSCLEIPTTLPTLDELLGFHGCTPDDFSSLILSRLEKGAPQVLTIHAELEGGPFKEAFARFLDLCLAQDVVFFRLTDWAQELLKCPQDIPAAPVFQGRLPGRAGTVSRQGRPEARS